MGRASNRRWSFGRRAGGRFARPLNGAGIAASSSFDPLSIFGSNLLAWYDMEARYLTTSSIRIVAVEDRTGNGYHLSQSNNTFRPYFRSGAGANGHDGAEFDGINNFLSASNFSLAEGSRPAIITIWSQAPNSSGSIYSFHNSTARAAGNVGGMRLEYDSDDNSFISIGHKDEPDDLFYDCFGSGTLNTTEHNLFEIYFDATNGRLPYQNQAISSISASIYTGSLGTNDNGAIDTLVLGSNGVDSHISGVMSLMLVLENDPTDVQVNDLRTWLNTEYSMSLGVGDRPSFDPITTFGSKLEAWYDFSPCFVDVHNGKVSYAIDRTGNGHHLSQSDETKRPSYAYTGGAKDRGFLTLDGTDDFLFADGFSLAEATRPSIMAVWANHSASLAAGSGSIVSLLSTTGSYQNSNYSLEQSPVSNSYKARIIRDTNPDTKFTASFGFASGALDGQYTFIETHFDSSGFYVVQDYQSASSPHTDAMGTNATGDQTRLYVGATEGDALAATGSLAALFILNDEPTEAERSAIHTYVSNSYGIVSGSAIELLPIAQPLLEPDEIFGAALEAWWDMDESYVTLYSDSNLIESVSDRSGNGHTLYQTASYSAKPLWASGSGVGPNGHGVAMFNGRTNYLESVADFNLAKGSRPSIIMVWENYNDLMQYERNYVVSARTDGDNYSGFNISVSASNEYVFAGETTTCPGGEILQAFGTSDGNNTLIEAHYRNAAGPVAQDSTEEGSAVGAMNVHDGSCVDKGPIERFMIGAHRTHNPTGAPVREATIDPKKEFSAGAMSLCLVLNAEPTPDQLAKLRHWVNHNYAIGQAGTSPKERLVTTYPTDVFGSKLKGWYQFNPEWVDLAADGKIERARNLVVNGPSMGDSGNDFSVSRLDLSQSNSTKQPTHVSGVNGNMMAVFDGTNTEMVCMESYNITEGSRPSLMAVWANHKTGTTNGSIVNLLSTTGSYSNAVFSLEQSPATSSYQVRGYFNTNPDTIVTAAFGFASGAQDGNVTLLEAHFSSSGFFVTQDFQSASTATITAAGTNAVGPFDKLYVGNAASGSYPATGSLLALYVLDDEPTAQELVDFRTYVSKSYNVTTGSAIEIYSTLPQASDPSTIFGSLLEAWWDFDSAYVTTTGSKITAVEDRSGNGHHLSQSTDSKRPLLGIGSGSNGTDAGLFDGVDDLLTQTNFGPGIGEGDRPHFMAVVKTHDPGTDAVIFEFTETTGAGRGFKMFYDNTDDQFSTFYRRQGEAFNVFYFTDFGAHDENHNLLEFHFSSSGEAGYLNGAETTAGSTKAFGTRDDGDASNFALGAAYNEVQHMRMSASCVLFLNNEPTQQQVDDFRTWVSGTYGITIV